MDRLRPKESTIKVLFALSGNKCAFSNCTTELVHERNNLIAQICHIEADKPGGARYNHHSSGEERRSAENLIILCPNHHALIDNDETTYTIELLKEMKRQHEFLNRKNGFELDKINLGRLMYNSGFYNSVSNWWYPTIVYSALTKIYEKSSIKISKTDNIRFELSDKYKKQIISVEADISGIEGSIYKLKRELFSLDRYNSLSEVICFVFCNSLITAKKQKNNGSIKLKKNACNFFKQLSRLQSDYEFNLSFVFLIEDEASEDSYLVLPLAISEGRGASDHECVTLDLFEHLKYQNLNNRNQEVSCFCDNIHLEKSVLMRY